MNLEKNEKNLNKNDIAIFIDLLITIAFFVVVGVVAGNLSGVEKPGMVAFGFLTVWLVASIHYKGPIINILSKKNVSE
jgi:hypothetical protein